MKRLLVIFGLLAPAVAVAEDISPKHLEFFEKKIRPVLAEKCYRCHSADSEKLKAGLQVDHREHLLSGGDSGPSVDLEKPEWSELSRNVSLILNATQPPS